jgi:hypothetical protein
MHAVILLKLVQVPRFAYHSLKSIWHTAIKNFSLELDGDLLQNSKRPSTLTASTASL